MDQKAGYLSNLTPLRGFAALLVATFHFEMTAGRFIPGHTTMFIEKSYLMVDLFFVLSGFIMLHVYRRDFDGTLPNGNLRHFYVARFARTYPLHLFTLLLLVVIVRYLTNWGNQPIPLEQPRDILPNVLLLQSFGVCKIYNWNIPSWSISAEWGAYLIFPLLALWISRRRRLAPVLLAVGVVAAWICIEYVLPRKNPFNPLIPVPHNLNTTYDFGWVRGIAGFCAGMVVYQFFYAKPRAARVMAGDGASLVIILLVAAGLHFAVNDALVALLFAALVLNFSMNCGWLHRICNIRLFQYLGDISYSIYLMQIFLQEPFSHGFRLPGVTGNARGRFNVDLWPGLGYWIVYVVLLVGLASLTYFLIERPCRRWINDKWGRPRVAKPAGYAETQ